MPLIPHQTLFWGAYVVWVVLRVGSLARLLAVATLRGDQWFFDAPLGDPGTGAAAARLRDLYRRWLILTAVAIEVLALAGAVLYHQPSHLILVQLPLFVVWFVVRWFILRSFMVRARELVAPPREKVAYSLKPRYLRDYTDRTFEIVNGTFLLGALTVLAHSADRREWIAGALITYIAVGLFLWKAAALRHPVVLPPEKTDDYLQLADDAMRIELRMRDTLRAVMTGMLVMTAVSAAAPDSWRPWRPYVALGFLMATAATAVALAVSAARQRQPLIARVKALQGPLVLRRGLHDPENLGLGGFVYWNADNPAVFVSGGPLRLAVNLLNKSTYLYAAYWIGLAILMVRMAGLMGGDARWASRGRSGVQRVSPVLVVADVQRSVEFYKDALGFAADDVYGDPPYFAILSRGGFDLMLSRAERPAQVRPHGPDGVWDVYLSVSDVSAEATAIQKEGARLDKGPTDTAYAMREIEVVDPDGHRICLGQRVH
jgi:catechol 2,3-dioxygenase-like lactoylglutathione lyase family enzyme